MSTSTSNPASLRYDFAKIRICRHSAMQAEVPAIVLNDDRAAPLVGKPVVACARDRNAIEQVVPTGRYLVHPADAASTFESDSELLANEARSPIATD